MDKDLYAIITPDPMGEAKSIILPIKQLGDDFFQEEDNNKTFKIKIVLRTKKWFSQFPETY